MTVKALKAHWARLLLGMLITLGCAGHVFHAWQIPLLDVLAAYFYDTQVRLAAPGTVDDRVVVVDLDEKSLAEEGRWPWGRDKVGELVRRLVDDYGVAVVGFDVVFAEPDDSSGMRVLESLAQGVLKDDKSYLDSLKGLRRELDYDQRMADILKGRPVVLGYFFSSGRDVRASGQLPPPVFPKDTFAHVNTAFTVWQGYGANLPRLQAAAAGAGHFNPIVDGDGVSRRIPLLAEYEGAYYEALSLAVLRTYLGHTELVPGIPQAAAGIEWFDVVAGARVFHIPVDRNAGVLIPYRGPERSFPYISATDVLKGRVPAEQLRGRIVLVGTSAQGLMDLRATPVGGAYPGVEIHANLIAGILDQEVKEQPHYVLFAELIQILLIGVLLTLALPFLSPLNSVLLTGGSLALMLGANAYLWERANLVLPLATVVVLPVLLYGANTAWGFFVEARSKRQITERFGQYVPPELVEEMARNPEHYSMEGRNAELSVLFSDIRDFTHLSEGMDPKSLTALMNEYLGAMTEVIGRQRGTLDKYIGDAIMCFWGAPVTDAEHAFHSVRAALDMQQELAALNARFKARNWPQLGIGIGINTGVMTVGDMGSPVRKAYTVMGDAVNLASRLEGLTKIYGVGIIVGEATRDLLRERVVFREIDRVRVKGKDAGVRIYEPLGFPEAFDKDGKRALGLWQQALQYYREQAWDQAELQLINLENSTPGTYASLCCLYRARIDHFRIHPPGADWDGVTTFQRK